MNESLPKHNDAPPPAQQKKKKRSRGFTIIISRYQLMHKKRRRFNEPTTSTPMGHPAAAFKLGFSHYSSSSVQSSRHLSSGCPSSSFPSTFWQVHKLYVHLPFPDWSLSGIRTSNGLPSSPPSFEATRPSGHDSSLSCRRMVPLTCIMLGTINKPQRQAPSGQSGEAPWPKVLVTLSE